MLKSKKLCTFVLLGALFTAPLQNAYADDSALMQQYKKDTIETWQPGAASEESTESGISASMIGWGIGLAIVITIAVALIHSNGSN